MTMYRPEKADELIQTAKAMVAPGKGILAIDESNGTCNKRFEAVGIDPTEQKRREYRELLLTTPDLEKYVSGAILYDETIRQSTADGKSFIDVMRDRGQVVGIKVDTGSGPEEIPADTVVIAVGAKSNDALKQSIESKGIACTTAGDAETIGMAFDAVHQGYHAGLKI